jgi:hypothetical protein
MTSKKNRKRVLVSFDWAIKRLLRDKVNFEVIEGFLSVLLDRKVKIEDVLESGSNRESPEDKHNCVDILVKDDSDELFLMEIQFIPEIDYFQRMLFGVSKTIVEHMFEGDEYVMVKKVYSINIVYFDLGHGKDYVYHGKTDFKGLHDNEILQLSDKQREIFGQIEAGDLYPEYYVLKINNFNDIATTRLDEWIYFLKNDRIEDSFSAPGLARARNILDYSRLSPEQQADYDHAHNEKSHYLSQIATAKYEGETIGEAKAAKIIEEQSKAIEEQSKAIEEKDKAIEEQSKAIEEQSKAIEEQSKEIAELKRLLNMK